jgi:dTDP-glucose pyrophosphorylase
MKLQNFLIQSQMNISQAIEQIDRLGTQIVFVVDSDMRLLGALTDGDFRRAILQGIALTEPVTKIMNPNPVTASVSDHRDSIIAKMKALRIRHIPTVDAQKRVQQIQILDDLLEQKSSNRPNVAVVMAGGLGKRLAPLTVDCPKPLLRVGGQPVLETILCNLIEHGFRKVYLSVNYKAEMIREYFGDGKKWNIEIEYLEEPSQMGTAGSLSLLPENLSDPFLVMNGDILTKIDLGSLMDFHTRESAHGTMCVRNYEVQIPYGVLKLDGDRISGIEEKPIHRFFVNGGIYVLDPKILKLLDPNVSLDMPQLFETMMKNEYILKSYPIREYWLDIGQIADFERANGEFTQIFRGE